MISCAMSDITTLVQLDVNKLSHAVALLTQPMLPCRGHTPASMLSSNLSATAASNSGLEVPEEEFPMVVKAASIACISVAAYLAYATLRPGQLLQKHCMWPAVWLKLKAVASSAELPQRSACSAKHWNSSWNSHIVFSSKSTVFSINCILPTTSSGSCLCTIACKSIALSTKMDVSPGQASKQASPIAMAKLAGAIAQREHRGGK
mmetsp:Transcript_81772/g.212745  ORF Transcript_81772/g.212745 Transcript_81772/m.212745 type:complete len:205 (-) Transcript_81772:48-662(-)